MQLGATSVRRTALAEKVYAKAAEIEKAREQARVEKQRAIREAREALEARFKPWPVVRIWTPRNKATSRTVLLATCAFYGIEPSAILSARKKAGVLRARQVGMFLAYEFTEASYPQIAEVFERDHTTVLHNVRVIRNLVAAGDQEIAHAVRAIRAILAGNDPYDDGNYWGC